MKIICRIFEEENNLTIYKIQGIIDFLGAWNAVEQYYQGNVTKNILIDLTEADLNHLSSDQIIKLANMDYPKVYRRKNGKTAYIASNDNNYGITRMFITIGQTINPNIVSRTFRNRQDAYTWITNRTSTKPKPKNPFFSPTELSEIKLSSRYINILSSKLL